MDSHLLDPRRTPAFGVTMLQLRATRENSTENPVRTRAYLAFGFFAPYLSGTLFMVFTPLQVQRTTHDVVTHTGQVLTTAANQHHAVLAGCGPSPPM